MIAAKITFSKTKLKHARKEKKLTLRNASAELEKNGAKIPYSTLSMYESKTGPYTPTADDMSAICAVYEKPIEYFYDDPDPAPKPKPHGKKKRK